MNRVIGYIRGVCRQVRNKHECFDTKKDATNLRHAQWDAAAVQMRRMRQEHAVKQIQSSLREFQRQPDTQVVNLRYEQASLGYSSRSQKKL